MAQENRPVFFSASLSYRQRRWVFSFLLAPRNVRLIAPCLGIFIQLVMGDLVAPVPVGSVRILTRLIQPIPALLTNLVFDFRFRFSIFLRFSQY